MTAALSVLQPGMFTSLQDLGRHGAQAHGVPVSGALDGFSLRLANALVGNAPGTGALELRHLGPKLRVAARSVRVALAGCGAEIVTDDPETGRVPAGRSVTLNQGTTFAIGPLRDSATAYLAVADGFDVPEVMGSVATYAPAALGGFAGRALAEGDCLPLALDTAPPGMDLQAARATGFPPRQTLRVVLGPQADYFSDDGLRTFLGQGYTVSPKNDRMGMRLDGPQVAHLDDFNIPSDGVVSGAIQVPGHGQPIVLLADRQTTGGYPKIATVISADLPQLARALPGTTLRFQPVEVAEAEALRRRAERELATLIEGLRPADLSGPLQRLYTENLISGATTGKP